MIKAVIFDVGGVLLRTTDHSHRQQWEAKLGLQMGELEATILNSEQGHNAQHGIMSEEAHWQWVGEHFKLNAADLAQLEIDFWAGDVMDMTLIDYIRSLRPRYQTAIISNAMSGLRHVLHHKHAIADAFDLIVVSAEEGIMKPDARIFDRTIARLECKPEETVFVDDFAHNIAGAEAVGMVGVHYPHGVDDVPTAFAQLGIQ